MVEILKGCICIWCKKKVVLRHGKRLLRSVQIAGNNKIYFPMELGHCWVITAKTLIVLS